MLKRRIGTAFVIMGAVLMLSALLLFGFNALESWQAGLASQDALESLQAAMNTLPRETQPEESDTPEATEPETIPEPTALTPVTIDGNTYIGYLSIPEFELELPIMDDWSMERLQVAPCLQYGSPLTNDAVIAGHNYKKHFLPLHDIQAGARVTFTDMTGYVIDYVVMEVKIIDPTNVYEVIDSEYDLILYTCTSSGQNRVTVRCNRATDPMQIPVSAGQEMPPHDP